jgi:formylmethanofuran dehydrogenase subunit C
MFTLVLKTPTTLPIELSDITPDRLSGKSLAEVERLSLWHGRQQVALADLFELKENNKDGEILLEGDLSSGVGIGSKMSFGTIRVDGNAGRDVGVYMSGGEIEILGDAGDQLGTEMRGGIIRVRGSAGNDVGAALPDSPRGMNGGAILISGNAGDGVGTRMRRGLIAVGGRVGTRVGHNLLAGTIVVGGECGQHAGAGMRRGTICILNPARIDLLPTFRYACVAHSPMLGLVGRELQSLEYENDIWNANRQWRQYNGDLLASGRGEIFLAAT